MWDAIIASYTGNLKGIDNLIKLSLQRVEKSVAIELYEDHFMWDALHIILGTLKGIDISHLSIFTKGGELLPSCCKGRRASSIT